ncbi:MAG: hypothetical protein AB9879_09380 [Methanothrix sp.]
MAASIIDSIIGSMLRFAFVSPIVPGSLLFAVLINLLNFAASINNLANRPAIRPIMQQSSKQYARQSIDRASDRISDQMSDK